MSDRFDSFINCCEKSLITERTEKYLNNASNKALKIFVTVSALKAVLAVFEGSEVSISPFGLGFDLEIGDTAQALYDYVDIAWKASLYGAIVLEFTSLVLKIIPYVGLWMLRLILLALTIKLSLSLFTSKSILLTRISNDFLTMSIVFTASVLFLLPFSIWGTSLITGKITNNILDQVHEEFDKAKETLAFDPFEQEVFPVHSKCSETALIESEKIIEETAAIALAAKGKTKEENWLDRMTEKVMKVVTAVTSVGGQIKDVGGQVKEFISKSYEAAIKRTNSYVKHVDKIKNYIKQESDNLIESTVSLIACYLLDCIVFPGVLFFVLFYLMRSLIRYCFDISKDSTNRTYFKALLAKESCN